MKLHIRICSAQYSVFFVPHSECEARKAFGWIDLDERAIFIDASVSTARQRQTLWHEIAHGLYEEYAFPVRQGEEATVTWLGKAIAEFVTANKAFTRRYLT